MLQAVARAFQKCKDDLNPQKKPSAPQYINFKDLQSGLCFLLGENARFLRTLKSVPSRVQQQLSALGSGTRKMRLDSSGIEHWTEKTHGILNPLKFETLVLPVNLETEQT